ncbi:hypothetical protein [Corynebacterium pseudogenitalium]|uniref:Uncharacterized protein n=1 Tax=Corynebacterium pseudogenitalium ATCC 33035 TaxID=525264 RepID=E2S3I0_9CORY|nr:hypothetical protein [Corynebacterium pseudogenitalium]EFQ80673.1 hypothetical protein HMPREF0305_11082 [Corynebacterium pseudogenitalium ATCC 33035]
MKKFFFTESIAPISYEVKLLRFPIETVVKEFEKWASGFDSPYAKPYLYRENHKVECNVHVKKVAAGRNQLAGLIKPQNHILQFVFVPTNSEWTAVFGPCSFPQSTKLPGIAEFSYDLALQQEITPQVPYYISIEHEPWVDNTDETFPAEQAMECFVFQCVRFLRNLMKLTSIAMYTAV